MDEKVIRTAQTRKLWGPGKNADKQCELGYVTDQRMSKDSIPNSRRHKRVSARTELGNTLILKSMDAIGF
jgi:hypothetical protein